MLTESLYHNGVQKSRELLSSFSHPAAVIALRGLDRLETHPSPQQAEARMQAEMVAQKRSLEQRFVILSTLGANAPFIGLLGTVIGILQAFDALGSTAASQAMAPQTVMVAIAEALVATAIGLGVAIPAIIACNAMQKLVKGALDDANILSSEIIAFLGSKSDCTPSQRPRTLRQVS